jgi:hypothetical protein
VTDFASIDFIRPRVISSMSPFTGYQEARAANVAAFPSSGLWPAANLAIFVPLTLPFAYPVKRVWWANGSPAGHNVDLGIYNIDGTRLFSTGLTAQSGASSVQYVTPSPDFILSPGRYFLALAYDSTAGQIIRVSTATVTNWRMAGFLQANTSMPLPASVSASWIAFAQTYVPVFGLTLDTTGF